MSEAMTHLATGSLKAKHMNYICTISADQIRALLMIAGDDATRPQLNGIYFDPARDSAVATDGKALLIVGVATDRVDTDRSKNKPFIAPRKLLQQALKLATKSNEQINVLLSDEPTPDERAVQLTGVKGELLGAEYDYRYPDYRAVVPSAVSGKPAAYDPEIVADMQKAMKLLTNDTAYCKPLQNGSGPGVVASPLDDNFLGLIMPLLEPENRKRDRQTAAIAAYKRFGFKWEDGEEEK